MDDVVACSPQRLGEFLRDAIFAFGVSDEDLLPHEDFDD
jgi:hypothetical protein